MVGKAGRNSRIISILNFGVEPEIKIVVRRGVPSEPMVRGADLPEFMD